MKVIKRMTSEEWPKEIVCPECGCTIEYDEYDLEDIDHGIGFQCPNCNGEVCVEKIKLHKFPDAFFDFSDGKKIPDDEVQKWVDQVAERLEEVEIGEWACIASGDTMVIGVKSEDEDTIYVTKKYWEENYNFR